MKAMISTQRTSRIFSLLLVLSSSCASMCWAGGHEAPKEGTLWGAALYEGQLPELKRMIQEKPELIDAVSPEGMTPLMWSGEEQAMFLLDKGAKADFISKDGENALFNAKSRKVIERLVKAGCNPNQISKTGESPLSQGLINYYPKAEPVEWLLEFGANPNLQLDSRRHTALYNAIWVYIRAKNSPEDAERLSKVMPAIITSLVKHGADADLKMTSFEGVESSPRSLAQNFPDILALLNQPRVNPIAAIQIGTGEIVLMGSLIKMDKDAGQIVIAAEKYTLPTGKSGLINPKKNKVIVVTTQTFIHFVNQDKKLTMADLTAASLAVVGADSGAGKPLAAREIVVTPAP